MNNKLLRCDSKNVIRITKEEAEKQFNDGKDIFMIPENVSPEAPLFLHSHRLLGVWANKTYAEMSFEEAVSVYEMWNCRSVELGKTAFYIETEV